MKMIDQGQKYKLTRNTAKSSISITPSFEETNSHITIQHTDKEYAFEKKENGTTIENYQVRIEGERQFNLIQNLATNQVKITFPTEIEQNNSITNDSELIYQSLAENITEAITVREYEEVLDFINKTPKPQDFVSWLNTIAKEVIKYFEGETLYLELFADPEGAEWDKLVLSVSTDKNADDGGVILDKFYNEVWFDNTSDFKRKLAVSLEFR